MQGELYTPSASELAQGQWAVVRERIEGGIPDLTSPAHIIPMFGRRHEIFRTCWCMPACETESGAWLHEVLQ